jgi:hypothetical protein
MRQCRACMSYLFPGGCLLEYGHEGDHVLRFGDDQVVDAIPDREAE